MKLYLNDKPVSNELKQYMEEIARRTEKISVIVAEDELESESVPDSERPFVKVLQGRRKLERTCLSWRAGRT